MIGEDDLRPTRYLVCPFVPPDQIGFGTTLYNGDDSEEAAGAIQRHLGEYRDGLVLVDWHEGTCRMWGVSHG